MEHRAVDLNARPEPIIDEEHLRNAALHVLLREFRAQQALPGTRPTLQTDPNNAHLHIVTCRNVDPTPYLRMGYIPREHYANLHFDANNFRFIRNIPGLWVTYSTLSQHDMDESFRDNPIAFRWVVQHHDTALAMGYLTFHKVKVR